MFALGMFRKLPSAHRFLHTWPVFSTKSSYVMVNSHIMLEIYCNWNSKGIAYELLSKEFPKLAKAHSQSPRENSVTSWKPLVMREKWLFPIQENGRPLISVSGLCCTFSAWVLNGRCSQTRWCLPCKTGDWLICSSSKQWEKKIFATNWFHLATASHL